MIPEDTLKAMEDSMPTVPTFYMVWHRPYWDNPIVQPVRSVMVRHKYRVIETVTGNKLYTTVTASVIHSDGLVESLSLDHGDQLYLVHPESDTFKVVYYA